MSLPRAPHVVSSAQLPPSLVLAVVLAMVLLGGCPQQVPDSQNFSGVDAAPADLGAEVATTGSDAQQLDAPQGDSAPSDASQADAAKLDVTTADSLDTADSPDTAPQDGGNGDTVKPDTVKPDAGPGDGGPVDVAKADAPSDTGPAPCVKDDDCTDVLGPCQTSQCSGGSCYPMLKNSGPCDDGNICTSGDVCFTGACQAGGPTNCDDGNPCTTDGCTAATGCTHVSFADGVGCGGGKTCTAGVCGGGLTSGVVGLTAGDYETCAIVAGTGKLLCWGDDKSFQVGSGATSGNWYFAPQTVVGLSGVTQVDCGANHCCAVTATGLFCWGNNEFGQVTAVGAPPTGTAKPLATPVKVLQPAVQVATGEHHTCARDNGGTVRCWGLGSVGQLGDGNNTVGAAAVVAKVGASVKSLDCGKSFCCAVVDDGTVKCWGLNMQGQIGTGITGPSAEAVVPTASKGVTGATAIASGDDHSCAIVTAGKVMCWGANGAYQTGNTGSSTQATPAQVPGFSGATAIAAGGDHTCALANGGLYCWGANGKMESAPGSTAIYVAVPTLVAGVTDPLSAALGYHHTCARTAKGALYCWGGNSLGQVGTGNSKDVKAPALIQ